MIFLSESAGQHFQNPIDPKSFFSSKKDKRSIRDHEIREQPAYGKPGESCNTNLFFGFFFDGTRNNYLYCEPKDDTKPESKRGSNPGCHSNVARLYDIYPGRSVPGVLPKDTDWTYRPNLYQHFFKTYIPGVGTEFKQIGDTGEGFFDGTLGAGAANNGNERIVWALVQAINCIHRFFKKDQLLINAAEAKRISRSISLSRGGLAAMHNERSAYNLNSGSEGVNHIDGVARTIFQSLLTRLHTAIQNHVPTNGTGQPAQLDPGIVQTIHMSVFGFSRGAAKARVFANWLLALGAFDAQLRGKSSLYSHTLGGLPFKIDFIGLFDTVASVGLANTLGNTRLLKYLDGHAAWADTERSLKVAPDVRCTHLVSAHEVRRSFPLDSICVNNAIGNLHEEIVFPGVHSDIGGGYAPGEQGKGKSLDGQDMLSRIPLLVMYRHARLAGVPLKLELATTKAQERFNVAQQTLSEFNAYLDTCTVGKLADDASATERSKFMSGKMLSDIFREQRKKYIHWRLIRRVSQKLPLEKTASFLRASQFDRNDLESANHDFEEEIKHFQNWLSKKGTPYVPKAQSPGFKNEHPSEWEEIASWWRTPAVVATATSRFFDEYVHDSRAWFKISGIDNEDEQLKALQVALAQLKRERMYEHAPHLTQRQLSEESRQAALEFERTGQIPRLHTSGREWFDWGMKAGHLRYRKIYAGHDKFLLSEATTPRLKEGATMHT